MRTLLLLTTSLLLTLGLNAKEISSNSTVGQYAKPGAAIDMKYTSQKVDANEVSDVNITLTSTIQKGTISVEMDLDKELIVLGGFEKTFNFQVTSRNEAFTINLQVKSQHIGLYYIRLLSKVDEGYGVKTRAFAIPIYVGKEKDIKKHRSNIQMKALSNGENISLSKAVETISIIKEK